MKAIYNKKTNNYFTNGKIYDVLADYRNRQSKQVIDDDGLVVVDNIGQQNMINKNDCIIIDNDITNVYIFNYKGGVL